MRLRFAVLASLLTAVTAAVTPAVVSAAPKHNHDLTIAAVPSHIIAGESVLIYGHLAGPGNGDQLIRLYHRVNPHAAFSLIGVAHTDSTGEYEFIRPDGIVETNRSWFVRGPDGSHSRTVHEAVQALVSIDADKAATDTRHTVVFTGNIEPDHPFDRVVLQQRNGSGDDWHTIASGFTRGNSTYRLTHRWSLPGVYELRTVMVGDDRNVRSYSDEVTVTVEQAQRPYFSIETATPVIDYGDSTTIAGVLDKVGTSTPDANVPVTLLERPAGSSSWTAIANQATGNLGGYSFTESPQQNTLYEVRVTLKASRHTAVLFEAVRDVVTATPSSTSAPAGSTITFSGTVLPGQSGTVVYLQRLGKDGDWHTVKVGHLNGGSGYSIAWTLGDVGTQTFRTKVLSDVHNAGGASPQMAITVTAPALSGPPSGS